jgi:hypothetical protein
MIERFLQGIGRLEGSAASAGLAAPGDADDYAERRAKRIVAYPFPGPRNFRARR